MAKILLVEDDQNLSEIYSARLSAEGYEIISATNGEDALAIAAREKPDLVISDVMMPRVSGFEMLDILKHTDGTVNVKTIMLTALGQDSDRAKANELGADKYLVKSQVTLEDIVNAVKELLSNGEDVPAPVASAAPTTATDPPAPTDPSPSSQAVPEPASQPQAPIVNNDAAAPTADPVSDTPSSDPAPVVQPPANDGVSAEPSTFAASSATTTPPTDTSADSSAASTNQSSLADPQQPDASAIPSTNLTTDTSAASDTSSSATADQAASPTDSQAEPLAQEEAELQTKLDNDSVAASTASVPTADQTDTSSQLGSQSPQPAVNQADSPNQPQPEASQPLADPVEPASAPPVSPLAGSSQPAVEPASSQTPEQTPEDQPAPSATSASTPPQQPNHDEVLAAALKELEGETSPRSDNEPQAKTEGGGEGDGTNNAIAGRKVIQPLGTDSNPKPDINQLLDQEAKNEIVNNPASEASPNSNASSDDLNNIAL